MGEVRKLLVKNNAEPCVIEISDEVASVDEKCGGCLKSEEVGSVLGSVEAIAGVNTVFD